MVSNEIKSRLEQFIRQEQRYIAEFGSLKKQKKDSKRTKIFAGELAVKVVGRLGRTITKSFLNQEDRFTEEERSVERKHHRLVDNIKSFLASVSMKRKNLTEPNSDQLITKIDTAQDYLRIDTKMRHTIKILRTILRKQLIYNEEILVQQKEIVIAPGKPFTSVVKLKEILRILKGYVKIIDTYVDEMTLELLLSIPEELPIKVLTVYTGGKGKEQRFLRRCWGFKEERPQFEIRKCDKNLIHDRFVLDLNQGWSIGSSLKDLGKKMSMINVLSAESKKETEKIFDEIWIKSTSIC